MSTLEDPGIGSKETALNREKPNGIWKDYGQSGLVMLRSSIIESNFSINPSEEFRWRGVGWTLVRVALIPVNLIKESKERKINCCFLLTEWIKFGQCVTLDSLLFVWKKSYNIIIIIFTFHQSGGSHTFSQIDLITFYWYMQALFGFQQHLIRSNNQLDIFFPPEKLVNERYVLIKLPQQQIEKQSITPGSSFIS